MKLSVLVLCSIVAFLPVTGPTPQVSPVQDFGIQFFKPGPAVWHMDPGDCVQLYWLVEGDVAIQVYLDGAPVAAYGEQTVCLYQDHTYVLRAISATREAIATSEIRVDGMLPQAQWTVYLPLVEGGG